MNSNTKSNMQVAVQWLQLATLIIGVGGLFLTIGRKDARLDANTEEINELREIATDLVRATVESTSNNISQDRQIDDLRNRVARLEQDQ
jgi:hypothetical protein|tara:strand:- start:273 stop:539 length:267 start_codon:yes stop_codon:yes gene_type:complete